MAASATSSRRWAAPTGSRRIETTQIQALAGRVTTGDGERETIEVERPATGQLLGTVPRCTADDVELAVQRARAAQEQWRETSFAERRRILLAFHDLVFDRREELLDLLQLESGKARRHAFEEVLDVGIVARYYARSAEPPLRTRRRRAARPAPPAPGPPPRRPPAADRGLGAPPPRRRGGDHRALELSPDAERQRRRARVRGRQRRGGQDGHADAVQLVGGARRARGGGPPARALPGGHRRGLRAQARADRPRRVRHVHGQHERRAHGREPGGRAGGPRAAGAR